MTVFCFFLFRQELDMAILSICAFGYYSRFLSANNLRWPDACCLELTSPLSPLVWDGAATYRPQRPDVMGLGVCAADSAQRAQTDNAGLCMYRGVVQCPQVFRAGFRIRLLVRYNIIGLFKLDEPLLYRNVFPVEFLFRGIPIAPKVFGPEEGHFRFFEYSVFCYGNRPGSICKTKG